MKIVILDLKIGNIGAVSNMIKKCGGIPVITSNLSEIENANKIIICGVGKFDTAMKNLNELNLIQTLNKIVVNKNVFFLGICLGMHLMCKTSEEGNSNGLGWIDAKVKKLNNIKNKIKIPHVGWNNVLIKKTNKLIEFEKPHQRFYFTHSYYVDCKEEDDICAITNYGDNFTSFFNKENLYGTQFHPEKSHKFGIKLIKNFINLK